MAMVSCMLEVKIRSSLSNVRFSRRCCWVFRMWCHVWCVVVSTSGACLYRPWMRNHYIRFKCLEPFAQW